MKRFVARLRVRSVLALAGAAALVGLIGSASADPGDIRPEDLKPYDIMVGCWNGQSEMYDQSGEHKGSASSTGSVYWKTRGEVMHFKQTMGPGQVLEYDFQVDGKSAKFRSDNIDVTGTEMQPGTYHFLLNFKTGPRAGNWYNNHHFTGPGQRMVLGSFEPAGQPGQVAIIAVQTLRRVPCERADNPYIGEA